MIRNRLAELLAERDLKISRVAAQLPNLSRNTITATASNTGKMIQLETVDTLCQFLHIEPTDFLNIFHSTLILTLQLLKTKLSSQTLLEIQFI
ncbi:TAL effector protein PthXo1 [Lactiplantibacillus plantarum]|nr:helix-turn-helix transcriptional regulator [Lactiplantibacillus plantarum]OUT06659.1 TAL effector protein PthXo1 [Lactiplantibacillus plantarum]